MPSTVREALATMIEDLEKDRRYLSQMVLKRVRKELKTLIVEREIIEIDTRISLEVCAETEKSSTLRTVPKYSNDKVRKAEITKRLANHPEFSKLVTRITRSKRLFAKMHANESMLRALIQKKVSLERLLFNDLEKG